MEMKRRAQEEIKRDIEALFSAIESADGNGVYYGVFTGISENIYTIAAFDANTSEDGENEIIDSVEVNESFHTLSDDANLNSFGEALFKLLQEKRA